MMDLTGHMTDFARACGQTVRAMAATLSPLRRARQATVIACLFAPPPLLAEPSTETLTNAPRAVLADSLDVAPVWAGHRVPFALLTHAPFQFVAFYDAERRMTVAQRRLDQRDWTFHPLPDTTGWDSHNSIVMAIDDTGFLHLSGDMHAVPLKYFRTSTPLDASSFLQINQMVGSDEAMTTYPRFFRGPNKEFLFTYRSGGSGNGNQIINVYEEKSSTWKRLLDKPLTDGQGHRNAYFDGPVKGTDGYFHMAWVWRETPDCATNHDLSYARSKDLAHWQGADGKALALPITLENSPVVDPVPEHGGLINSNVKIGFDDRQRVTISYHKNDAAGHTQPWNARLEDGSWRFYQITDWPYRWNFGGGGTLIAEIRLGPVQHNATGQLTQSFRHAKFGHGTWAIDPLTLRATGTLMETRMPATLEKVDGTFPGLDVRWAEDAGDSGNPRARYALRWETLDSNRDAPRTGPLPTPSMLRVCLIETRPPQSPQPPPG